MLRKTVALAALAAAFVVAPATAAVADPYTPKIPTETSIEVTCTSPGDPISIVVSASANYPTPPEGDISVVISASSGAARNARSVVAAPLFTTTVHFTGDPITIEGPSLPKGAYIGTAALTPDDSNLFLPSDDTDAFRVCAGGETAGEEEGGLPGTGGPSVMWLILGTGLVGAGAGGVTYSRRRQGAAA